MNMIIRVMAGVAWVLAAHAAWGAAEVSTNAAAGKAGGEVVCKGQGLEVRRAELDLAVDQFKANAVARGQTVPDQYREEVAATLLDRLVVTKLLLKQAVEADRRKGLEQSSLFLSNVLAQAGSEAAYERQLLSLAFKRKDFEEQVRDRAICEEVIDRVLAPKVKITDEEVKAKYEESLDQLRRPEMVRASHILLSTKDMKTGQDLTDAQKAEKKALAAKLVERAKKGEDFAALAKEYSEDPGSKDNGGEYMFPRGQMVKEFEDAAFGLETNKVSDIVTTQFGYHVIKMLQRIPAETIELAKVQDDIRKSIQAEKVQEELLPEYIKKLRAEAELEYLNGGRPPAVASETPAGSPDPAGATEKKP